MDCLRSAGRSATGCKAAGSFLILPRGRTWRWSRAGCAGRRGASRGAGGAARAGEPEGGPDARSGGAAARRAAGRARPDDPLRSAAGSAGRLRSAGEDGGGGHARSGGSRVPRRPDRPDARRAYRAGRHRRGAGARARGRLRRSFRPGPEAVAMIAVLLAIAVQVGSKQFTESVILAEIAGQTLRAAGVDAEHRRELGGTRVLWEALRVRQIDVYPEYTGTISEELLRGEADLAPALERNGMRMAGPLGFEDTYAIGMRRSDAARLGVRSLSQLAGHS